MRPTYLDNLNAAIKGECSRHQQGRKPSKLAIRRLMKLARYLSRAIHG